MLAHSDVTTLWWDGRRGFVELLVDDNGLERHDTTVGLARVVHTRALVATVVVSQDRLVVRQALVAELVVALGTCHVVAAAVLLDADFALWAWHCDGFDKGFCLLVVEIAEVLASLALVLARFDLGGDRDSLGGSGDRGGTSSGSLMWLPVAKAEETEFVCASCAYSGIYQPLYRCTIGERTYKACEGILRFSRF